MDKVRKSKAPEPNIERRGFPPRNFTVPHYGFEQWFAPIIFSVLMPRRDAAIGTKSLS